MKRQAETPGFRRAAEVFVWIGVFGGMCEAFVILRDDPAGNWGAVLLSSQLAFPALSVAQSLILFGVLSSTLRSRWSRGAYAFSAGVASVLGSLALPLLLKAKEAEAGFASPMAFRLGGIALSLAAASVVAGFLAQELARRTDRTVKLRGLRAIRWAGLSMLIGSGLAALGWPSTPSGEPIAPEPSPDAGPKKPNVVLISVDTLRADHLGTYGYSRGTDPRLRAFFARGLRFDMALSPVPKTRPSHAAMLTGVHPGQLGMRWNDIPLPSGVPTLPEVLKAEGYQTAGFVAGYPLFGDQSGLRRGFDHYSDVFFPLLAIHKGLDRLTPVLLLRKLGLIDTLTRTANDVTEEALRWLEAVARRPFFLFVHYYDPHSYYTPPARFRRELGWEPGMARTNRWMLWQIARGRTRFLPRDVETVRCLYDAEIRFVDHEIGRLLAKLKALGLQRSSIVIVTADHGETLLERVETTGKAFTHGDWLHERDLRVPLLMTGPGIPQGVVTAPVGLDDIAPTVLGLLRMSPAKGMTGVELLGASSELLNERAVVSYNSPDPGEPTRVAVHLRRYRLLIEPESSQESLALAGNAREGTTVTGPTPQDLKAMRELGLALPIVEKRRLLDPAEMERLRALGYAQ